MQLLRVCEIAKTLRKSRNQIRGLILKHGIKSIETRTNIYGGITNYRH